MIAAMAATALSLWQEIIVRSSGFGDHWIIFRKFRGLCDKAQIPVEDRTELGNVP
jgi:hypothetical protein